MTSPFRKRSDRERKRLSEIERLELVELAKQSLKTEFAGDTGETYAPLTRTDFILIGRAIRDGWDVPEAKRQEIIQQTLVALDSDNDRLSLAAVRVVVLMEAANHEKR